MPSKRPELDLSATREEYVHEPLRRSELHSDPLIQFQHWYQQANQACRGLENAMQLATVDQDGHPDVRTVLLKIVDQSGFSFFTNLESKKGLQIAATPSVALVFHWQPLHRQVIVRGTATPIPREEVEDYFSSRPRGSQLGAWASKQSSSIESRSELEAQLSAVEDRFDGQQVSTPDSWGGFCVEPKTIEFWQGQPNRLHDRFVYKKGGEHHSNWSIQRISP